MLDATICRRTLCAPDARRARCAVQYAFGQFDFGILKGSMVVVVGLFAWFLL